MSLRNEKTCKALFLFRTCMLALLPAIALAQSSAGVAKFEKRVQPWFDSYLISQDAGQRQWMLNKFYRMEVYSPFFDNKTSWYPRGLVYDDLYAIQTNSPVLSQHPEWVLKDQNGNWMYIPWGCFNGTCPQYAGDIANPSFRTNWINQARTLLSHGYAGLWIDDVNMEFRVADAFYVQHPPIDSNTGQLMTWDAWRSYVAQFVEQIRAAFPSVEIVHNSIWYAGPEFVALPRDQDPYIQRQIRAANVINVEHGIISDTGLTGGTGAWSMSAVLDYVNRVHKLGTSVTFLEFVNEPVGFESALAGYFLISSGTDRIADDVETPDNWWSGYDVDLGAPLGPYTYSNGVFRRDYTNGRVLLNEPGAPTTTIQLSGSFMRLNGSTVSSVTLGARQGAVLRSGAAAAPPPPTPGGSVALSDLTWTSMINGWGPAERNMSNGESAAGDGRTLSLKGVTYAKGLGVHSTSAIHYGLAGLGCSVLTAVVGVDDEVAAGRGSVVFQVWGDGVKLYESPRLVSGNTAVPISVNIAGRGDLLLATTDSGDGNAYDHADWADAQLTCASGGALTRYLSDVSATSSANGYGPVERDMSNGEANANDGRPTKVGSVTFAKGLGVHSSSTLHYALSGVCSVFGATVGVDAEVPTGLGSVTFQVWGDGVKLYESPRLVSGNAGVPVSVNISGKSDLGLIVTDAGDGKSYDHADWADARITCSQ